METDQFIIRLRSSASAVEMLLEKLLDNDVRPGERLRPPNLMAAMRHGVLNGGKRMRPVLVMEATLMLGGPEEGALRVAAALECVHCYSLVHDDLPAMDDDDMRRGQPTVHKAFGEAAAILAGDSLLTLAFDIIADMPSGVAAETRLALVLALARASGMGGMAGGQALDLEAERQAPDEAGIIALQAMKTGALIRFACEAGAILSSPEEGHRQRMAQFGDIIGLAFQLRDDVLDLTADAEVMGKATGKDAGRGKATLVSARGIDWAEQRLVQLVSQAEILLEPYGEKAAMMMALARYVATREH